MFANFRKWLHKKIYKSLIYKTIVLDKNSIPYYEKLETFCALEVNTDKGIFKFLFKKDRRKNKRKENEIPAITNYIIELIVPDELLTQQTPIKDKIVIVVKVMLFKPDYEILTELLTDTYLDTILGHITKRNYFST